MTEVHKATAKKVSGVTVNIRRGPAVSPAQKQAWRRFWQELIAGVKAGGQ